MGCPTPSPTQAPIHSVSKSRGKLGKSQVPVIEPALILPVLAEYIDLPADTMSEKDTAMGTKAGSLAAGASASRPVDSGSLFDSGESHETRELRDPEHDSEIRAATSESLAMSTGGGVSSGTIPKSSGPNPLAMMPFGPDPFLQGYLQCCGQRYQQAYGINPFGGGFPSTSTASLGTSGPTGPSVLSGPTGPLGPSGPAVFPGLQMYQVFLCLQDFQVLQVLPIFSVPRLLPQREQAQSPRALLLLHAIRFARKAI